MYILSCFYHPKSVGNVLNQFFKHGVEQAIVSMLLCDFEQSKKNCLITLPHSGQKRDQVALKMKVFIAWHPNSCKIHFIERRCFPKEQSN